MDITKFVMSRRDNALLLGDYGSYRSQLSRRLLTVRKRLGRTTTPKNGKYAPKAPLTARDVGRNREFVDLFLLTAERAWAQAMHMKSTHSEDNASKGITGSTRSHIISRLHKASKSAQELVALLKDQDTSGATDADILEARAYAASLSGAEEFEKQFEGQRPNDAPTQDERWQKCLAYYSEARVIYAALMRETKKDLFKEVLASTIDPSIRYAAYQSHLPRTTAVLVIAKRCFPRSDSDLTTAVEKLDPDVLQEEQSASGAAGKDSGSENVPNTINWRSRTANIADASIGQALAAVATAEAQLSSFLSSENTDSTSREKAAAYDEVLIASQDAADATRRAIDELEKEGVDEGDARMQDLRVTSLAVNYALIGWRVGRNRVLIGREDGALLEGEVSKKPKRPRKDGKEWVEKEEANGRKLARLRERVVLYDATLQSIDSVKELRGAVRDAAFVEELEGKRAYFQALKCLNIAYSHALLSNHQSALALLARALDLASSSLARSSRATAPSAPQHGPPTLAIYPSQISSLYHRLDSLIARHRALAELHKFQQNSIIADAKNMTTSAPLVQRLHDYPAAGVDLKNLVVWPPKLEPVPVKPIFLDVAWNYIEYPGRATQIVANGDGRAEAAEGVEGKKEEEEEKPQPQEKKRGWFGFGR
ncbi:hypothetical protein BJ546DRAFT_987972 [Cryomyces antarcticus]